MPNNPPINGKTEVQRVLEYCVWFVWFYTFGGILKCAGFALNRSTAKAFEFAGALILMLFGAWMLFPTAARSEIPFVQIMQAPVFGMDWFMPLWVSGLMLIVTARITMHFTLTGNPHCRVIWLFISAFVCGTMFWFNALSAFVQFPSALLVAMIVSNVLTMAAAGKEVHALEKKNTDEAR